VVTAEAVMVEEAVVTESLGYPADCDHEHTLRLAPDHWNIGDRGWLTCKQCQQPVKYEAFDQGNHVALLVIRDTP
jgi:hypothetical protein